MIENIFNFRCDWAGYLEVFKNLICNKGMNEGLLGALIPEPPQPLPTGNLIKDLTSLDTRRQWRENNWGSVNDFLLEPVTAVDFTTYYGSMWFPFNSSKLVSEASLLKIAENFSWISFMHIAREMRDGMPYNRFIEFHYGEMFRKSNWDVAYGPLSSIYPML